MKRVLIVVGTRPEAIKLAPVYERLAQTGGWEPELLLTGQHREMARQALAMFGLRPAHDLDLMLPGQTLLDLCARLPQPIAEIFRRTSPDVIVVQGDTTSAMVAALLGFNVGCPVAHVEAGLRTGDLRAPFPEEFNRRVISLASHWHFAPTLAAAAQLQAEGIERNVHVVGNTVIDAVRGMAERLARDRSGTISARFPFLGRQGVKTVLVTSHRRENHGAPMQEIAAAIAELSAMHADVQWVVPVHPNPACAAALKPALSGLINVHLVEPLQYDELVYVLQRSHLVVTDSGGLQEESPAFGVPVVVLRDQTERPEGLAAGCSVLAGTDRACVVEWVNRLLTDDALYSKMHKAPNPYGDGTASMRIVDILAGDMGV